MVFSKIVSLVKLLLEHGNSFFVYVKVFRTAASLNLPSWAGQWLVLTSVHSTAVFHLYLQARCLHLRSQATSLRGADALALAPVEFPITRKGLLLRAGTTGLVCIELRPLEAHLLRSTLLLEPPRLWPHLGSFLGDANKAEVAKVGLAQYNRGFCEKWNPGHRNDGRRGECPGSSGQPRKPRGRRPGAAGPALRLQGGGEGRPCAVPRSAALPACREQGPLSALVGVKVAHSSGQRSHPDVVSFKQWFLATEMAPEVWPFCCV